jgi:predicted RNA polymerase sigma factor
MDVQTDVGHVVKALAGHKPDDLADLAFGKMAGHASKSVRAALYEVLARRSRSPVIALNHAVAVAMSRGFETGLEQIEQIAATGDLDSYYLYHAARADLLHRLRRNQEALATYERALSLSANAVERRYLRRRMAELSMWEELFLPPQGQCIGRN